MPVTVHPAGHSANPINTKSGQIRSKAPSSSARDLLRGACTNESPSCAELLQSSFGRSYITRTIYASSNGLVNSAIMAYNEHHHLKIRPEDVWFAILSQLNFYINAHAEELRSMFVAHEGQKELTLQTCGNRYTVDYGVLAKRMGGLIEENILDPELREWMMPSFSTTTKDDTIIASILLMGATQAYFTYRMQIRCGLPSVTILGEKSDWELILRRLEKIKTFGDDEPTQFYNLLKPIIRHFILSFDTPASDEVINFWQRIAHFTTGGSGPSWYSGWISAFCFWDDKGKYLLGMPSAKQDRALQREKARRPALVLDGVVYGHVDTKLVPQGYTTVPVVVDDNGHEFPAMMIAGSVGIGCSGSEKGEGEGHEEVVLDTVQPETGWWMFEKKTEEPNMYVEMQRAQQERYARAMA